MTLLACFWLKFEHQTQWLDGCFLKERWQVVHTISAGVAVTFAVFLLTVGTREATGAAAGVAAGSVLLTGAAVKTRIVGTLHVAGFTVLPVEALRTRTQVAVDQVLETEDRQTVSAESRAVNSSSSWSKTRRDHHKGGGHSVQSLTLQLPPFRQGLLSHSLVSVSQLTPVKPGGQVQV